MDIKWSIGVSYVNLDNKRLFTSYTVNARNKATAENIGRELFLMEMVLCVVTQRCMHLYFKEI